MRMGKVDIVIGGGKMISKEELFRKLKEKHPDKDSLKKLASCGEIVMRKAEKLKGKTITLSLPADMSLDSIVAYVAEKEEELANGLDSILGPYGFYKDVRSYINWQKQIGYDLLRREFFYDLVAQTGYDPAGKKIVICDTVKTCGGPSVVALREVISVCDGSLVDSLGEADTAAYVGERFCDPKDNSEFSEQPLYSLILPELQRNEDMAALVCYNVREVGVCSDEEGKAILYDLARQRRNIHFMPVGDWYKGRIFRN